MALPDEELVGIIAGLVDVAPAAESACWGAQLVADRSMEQCTPGFQPGPLCIVELRIVELRID